MNLDETKKKIKNIEDETSSVYDLSIKMIDRNYKLGRIILKGLSILCIGLLLAVLWLSYDNHMLIKEHEKLYSCRI
jgi:hypothetical protein